MAVAMAFASALTLVSVRSLIVGRMTCRARTASHLHGIYRPGPAIPFDVALPQSCPARFSSHPASFSPALPGIHVIVVQNIGTAEVDLQIECQTTAGPPIQTAVHLAAEAVENKKAAGDERVATNYEEPEKTARGETWTGHDHHIGTAAQHAAGGWFEGKYGRLARV